MTHPLINAGLEYRKAQDELLRQVLVSLQGGLLESCPSVKAAALALIDAEKKFRVVKEKTLQEYPK